MDQCNYFFEVTKIENIEFLENREQIFWETKNNKKMIKKHLNLDWDYTRKQLKKLHKKR